MKRFAKCSLPVVMLILLVALVWASILLPLGKAEPLDTHHSSWHLIRETAIEDGTNFAATYNLTTESNFANKDSSSVANGGPFKIVSQSSGIRGRGEGYSAGSKWQFAVCGKNMSVASDNASDNTFAFNIIGWSKTNGMLQTIATGTGILGTQAVIVYPDGGACVGDDVTATGLAYTHSDETFTGTASEFDGMAVEMMAYVTAADANLTSGYYAITTYTDVNTIVMSGISSTANSKLAQVQVNPAFWADTIVIADRKVWPGSMADPNTTPRPTGVNVSNSANNQVAIITVETSGLEWVQFVFYNCDGATGIEAGALTVYGRRY